VSAVVIEGYAGPLVDGAAVMGGELLWPAYLYGMAGVQRAPEAFGAGVDAVEGLLASVCGPESWPVFTVPLAGGARLHVVAWSGGGEGGVEYVVEPGGGVAAFVIGELTAHCRGPALSWPELVAVSGGSPERLLLLVGGCADGARPAGAVGVVAAALSAVGAVCDQGAVAAELLEDPVLWDPATRWVTAGDGVVTCAGGSAPRRPGGLDAGLLRLVSGLFR
jgi:hypothetical protein